MSEQKVPLLTAEQARLCLDEEYRVSLQRVLRQHCEAIATGAAVVIPRAELEAKDAQIAALSRCLAFFKAVILSGESWSPICQGAYDKAIAGEAK